MREVSAGILHAQFIHQQFGKFEHARQQGIDLR